MNVHFILADYQSHRRAGVDYQRALKAQGVMLVDSPAEADIVVIHDEPWTLPLYYRALPVLRQRYVIAYAVWEPSTLSVDLTRWLGLVDEIWTCSDYCRSVLAAAKRPITVIPHIVASDETDATAAAVTAAAEGLRARLGLTDTSFVFYTISRQEERKNLEAGIRAFARAFPDGATRYIVKTPYPLPTKLARTPGLINPTENFSDVEVAALHRLGHCYVSSHCAEGWGLCLSDAMAEANLLIATGYSGNMEYMSDQTAIPVRYSLEPIRSPATRVRFGFEPTSTEAEWAYVDEEHLCASLRRAAQEWDALAPMREAAQRSMGYYCSSHIGEMMLRRLATIFAGLKRKEECRPAPRFARPMA